MICSPSSEQARRVLSIRHDDGEEVEEGEGGDGNAAVEVDGDINCNGEANSDDGVFDVAVDGFDDNEVRVALPLMESKS